MINDFEAEVTGVGGRGDLNVFYWYQIFVLDSILVKTQKCLARFLTYAMYHHSTLKPQVA